jgi:polysaccharide biosynthesis/export protein
MVRYLSLLVIVCALLAGCNINRDVMFKTPLDYQFDVLSDSLPKAFKLQANDQITFRLFANDGFRMIDLVDENGTGQRNALRASFNYQIDFDGQAKMPMLGLVKLEGLTVREAEALLERQYTIYYNRPFVQLQVNTRRVVVFPGGGGDARVVPLENNNTTLMEALAAANGLSKRADSRKVKLFRRDSTGVRKVYQFNMSDINGLEHADIVMLADDIVYVQPSPEIARELINDINPFITLLTTTVLVIGIVRGFSK